MDFAELKQRLANLDTACICDARKSVRVVSPEIRPLVAGLKLIGRARTVSCHNDFLSVVQSLAESEEGDVLVIDGQGGERAMAGELFATEASRRGLSGIVIDGSCRDTRLLKQMKIPVYCRWVFPNAGTTVEPGDKQIPVTIGGVTVNPGDIVFGDDDGLVVSDMMELAELIHKAEDIQRRESEVLKRMQAGQSLFDVLDLLTCCGDSQKENKSAVASSAEAIRKKE